MFRFLTFTLAAAAGLIAQEIQSYDLQKPAGSPTGILLVTVSGREMSVSNQAIRAWSGWNATKLLYTTAETSADSTPAEALRIYDAPSATSRTLTVENASITDVTHVLLRQGEIGFVISLQDNLHVPWVALANEKTGVYRRERYAVPGPIIRDTVELRHFNPEDLQRAHGDLSQVPPARTSTARLLPGDPSPLGRWVATLPAADAARRNITLDLRQGGMAEMLIDYSGKGSAARRGTWSQIESTLLLEFPASPGQPPSAPLEWELRAAELIPKSWSREEYGTGGLPMKRAAAPMPPR